ncbi:MAG: phosphate uptake regulator PhoU [Nanoarchaeota archaeon]
MEYRKLISFGKSSYVISLPKSWIKHNSLKKGDVVYLEESGPSLLLSKRDASEQKEEKEKVICVDGKPSVAIGREVYSAYIQNYRRIVLKGKEIKNKVKELQTIIQSLIALEIMEQTSDSIVAKDFLNMDNVSVLELIRKMDVVTRTMMKETCSIFKEDNYESLNERDMDVNRLYFLFYRAILYNLENPSKALKNLKLSGKDLLAYQFIGFYIEAIADEVRRAARYARLLKVTSQKEKQIENILLLMNDFYVQTMKAAYNKDVEFAYSLSEGKQNLSKGIESLEAEAMKIPNLYDLVNRLKRMSSLVHNMGRVVYTVN